jgi:hypothetical protein
MEDKTKRATDSQSFELAPPLLVTLVSDLGKLPAGIIIRFPHEAAMLLVAQRYAVPIADFNAQPDLVVDAEQLLFAGLPTEFLPLEALLETGLEAA